MGRIGTKNATKLRSNGQKLLNRSRILISYFQKKIEHPNQSIENFWIWNVINCRFPIENESFAFDFSSLPTFSERKLVCLTVQPLGIRPPFLLQSSKKVVKNGPKMALKAASQGASFRVKVLFISLNFHFEWSTFRNEVDIR